jgi:hypothetical protein
MKPAFTPRPNPRGALLIHMSERRLSAPIRLALSFLASGAAWGAVLVLLLTVAAVAHTHGG